MGTQRPLHFRPRNCLDSHFPALWMDMCIYPLTKCFMLYPASLLCPAFTEGASAHPASPSAQRNTQLPHTLTYLQRYDSLILTINHILKNEEALSRCQGEINTTKLSTNCREFS